MSTAQYQRRIARYLMGYAARLLSPGRSTWADGMVSEYEHIDDDSAALRWASGCLWASVLERMNTMVFSRRANRIGAIAPIVMSLLALTIVLVAASSGGDQIIKGESVATHFVQLLLFGQAPFVMTYLLTADWRRRPAAMKPIAAQFGALTLAVGAVTVFCL